ncbi:MAG: MFS transporter [Clostridia bacterium]|nr:MFS transporter [Clostridia bacterium]
MSKENKKEKNAENGEKDLKKYSYLLIVLCWIVYACSYIGKLGYNANIIQIENAFNISHAESGTVSSFFFFAYGAGQIINGLFCKRYNLKYVVFGGLILSGISNILIGVVTNFEIVKYLWVINGGALSVLWVSLIRFLSETLDKKYMSKAVVVMGTTVATGTFLVYGLSALFVALKVFKLIFFMAGILLPVIAITWFISSPLLAKKLRSGQLSNEIESKDFKKGEDNVEIKRKGSMKNLWGIFIIFGIYAIMTNLIKDGLTTWVPIVLKDIYGLPDYISILLTLLLPLCAIFGATVVVTLNKKIKNFVSICTILFTVSCILIGIVITMLHFNIFIVAVISFAIIACSMQGTNNLITSVMPLYWKDKINSGMVAGIFNGCCYIGSMISSYGLGLIADLYGWNFVFWLLFFVCFVAVVIGISEFIIRVIKGKQRGK